MRHYFPCAPLPYLLFVKYFLSCNLAFFMFNGLDIKLSESNLCSTSFSSVVIPIVRIIFFTSFGNNIFFLSILALLVDIMTLCDTLKPMTYILMESLNHLSQSFISASYSSFNCKMICRISSSVSVQNLRPFRFARHLPILASSERPRYFLRVDIIPLCDIIITHISCCREKDCRWLFVKTLAF